MHRLVTIVLTLLLLVPAAASSQGVASPEGSGPTSPIPPETIVRDDTGQATVRAVRLDAPLNFDGRLDEAIYRNVKSFGDFIQQDPFEGGPPTDKTEVWVMFDADNFYVAARLWEIEPDKRVANEMRRDSFNLYNNDHFAVGIA